MRVPRRVPRARFGRDAEPAWRVRLVAMSPAVGVDAGAAEPVLTGAAALGLGVAASPLAGALASPLGWLEPVDDGALAVVGLVALVVLAPVVVVAPRRVEPVLVGCGIDPAALVERLAASRPRPARPAARETLPAASPAALVVVTVALLGGLGAGVCVGAGVGALAVAGCPGTEIAGEAACPAPLVVTGVAGAAVALGGAAGTGVRVGVGGVPGGAAAAALAAPSELAAAASTAMLSARCNAARAAGGRELRAAL